jgi:RHS repeat-associated protein
MRAGSQTVGHPVNVATGLVYSTHEDVSITGKADLTWERRYNTGLRGDPPSPLGKGWTARYFAILRREGTGFRFVAPEGGEEVFDDPDGVVDRGGVVRNLGTFQEIGRKGQDYVITRWDIFSGDIERLVFPAGKKGEAWPLVSIEDVTGQGVDLIRDGTGRLTGIRQRLEKRSLILEYTSGDRVGSVAFLMPDGRKRALARYEYDRDGLLVAAFDTLGFADRYEYDSDARLTREILKDGGVFTFRYDDQGRCVRTSGLNRYDEKTLRYFDHIRATEVVNSLGAVTRYHWLSSGQVVSRIDPLGGRFDTRFDLHGRIVARTDPVGAAERLEYNDQGDLAKITDPLDRSLEFTYNSAHRPVTLTDQAGNVWRRVYDTSNRLIGSEDPAGRRWEFQYDREGRLTGITDPDHRRRRVEHSDDNRMCQTTGVSGEATRYQFDDFGQIEQTTNPLGGVTRYRYDGRGFIVEVEYPDGARFQFDYDSAGNLVRMTDGEGRKTRREYGPCGRLLRSQGPLGSAVEYSWSTEPRKLERIRNENGEIYILERDQCGRVTSETGFDGRVIRFEYNLAGNCTALINGLGEKTSFVLDALGRVVTKVLPDGESIDYGYDLLGYLSQASNSTCEVQFERDFMGRVVVERQGEFAIESRYDAMGARTWTKTSRGLEVSYEYDSARRFTRLATHAGHIVSCRRDPMGREAILAFPGGATLAQGWDVRGRMTSQELARLGHESLPVATGAAATTNHALRERLEVERRYRYDKLGNVASTEDGRWGTHRFTYDDEERLTVLATDHGTSERFRYDRAGNLVEVGEDSTGATMLEYLPGNRLLRRGDTEYRYDQQGRLVEKVANRGMATEEVRRYHWGGEDELRSLTAPDGKTWSYLYDPFGRRVSKQGPGGAINYFWDGDVIVHESEDHGEETTWIFDPHSFKPLLKLSGNAAFSVICDRLGSPREMIDGRGDLAWSVDLKAWGETREILIEKSNCPFRFLGQSFDEESGHCYNRYRYYDPETGRYLSQDPIRLRNGTNFYSYGINPANWVDPFGLNTPPSLPDRTVLQGNGVRVVQNYGDMNREHADPIHFHVDGPGIPNDTRIKADGTVLSGRLTPQAEALLEEPGNINRLRRAEDRITRVIRDQDAKPGGRPFRPGNRGLPAGAEEEEEEEEC